MFQLYYYYHYYIHIYICIYTHTRTFILLQALQCPFQLDVGLPCISFYFCPFTHLILYYNLFIPISARFGLNSITHSKKFIQVFLEFTVPFLLFLLWLNYIKLISKGVLSIPHILWKYSPHNSPNPTPRTEENARTIFCSRKKICESCGGHRQ